MSVFGIKFEGWRNAASNAGRWFQRVEERAQLFIRKLHETRSRRAIEPRENAVAAPSIVGISKRPGRTGGLKGGGGGGDALEHEV